MAAKIKITDRDRGWKRIKRDLSKAGDQHVAVGVIGGKASAEHEGGGQTVADVAVVHEYGATVPKPSGGTFEIPQRSFLRSTVDDNAKRYKVMLGRVARGVTAGRTTATKGLALVGTAVEGDIKKRIADGIPPALKQTTIDRKGSTTPLIDTGQLRNSVASEVRQGKAHG